MSEITDAWNSIVGGGADAQRIIAEETRKAALEATRGFLQRVDVKAIDELRKNLDLPPETLGALIEIHAKKLAELETPRPSLSGHEVLPFYRDGLIKRGQCVEITARPQRAAFRPERVFVSNNSIQHQAPWWKRLSPWYRTPKLNGAADWLIHEIRIGNRSQFSQAGAVPGDMFLSTAVDSFLSFDTAQLATDIKMIVEYIGACPKGQRFIASMVGTAAI